MVVVFNIGAEGYHPELCFFYKYIYIYIWSAVVPTTDLLMFFFLLLQTLVVVIVRPE